MSIQTNVNLSDGVVRAVNKDNLGTNETITRIDDI